MLNKSLKRELIRFFRVVWFVFLFLSGPGGRDEEDNIL